MSGIKKYNPEELLNRAAKVLGSGALSEVHWGTLAEAVGVPRSTLKNIMTREYKITKVTDLLKISAAQASSRTFRGILPQTVLEILHKGPRSLEALANELDRSPETVNQALTEMIGEGYAIVRSEQEISMPPYEPAAPLGVLYDRIDRTIKFAVMADLHIGSKHAQVSAIRRFVQIAADEGVENILVAGDLLAGIGVYRGQHNDLYAHSASDQIDSLCHILPELPGVKYFAIGGNHDYSFIKAVGINVIKVASLQRPDLVYCGYDYAEIPLTSKKGAIHTSAVLWHPSGGVPYALSYRGQKMAAEVTRDQLTEVVLNKKPPAVRFVFWGHLHVSDIFPHGSIWVAGPGCFEGTNSYLKQKGLRPIIQGLIVTAHLTDDGLVARSTFDPITFSEQVDDYQTGWEPAKDRDQTKIEVLFSEKNP